MGQLYTRPELATLWGYKGFEAISRGAVTPAGLPYVILFITEEKQQFLTQYKDSLVDGILEIEGETDHAADDRLINARSIGDEIHLFHRKKHHMSFTYCGRIVLIAHRTEVDKPSWFKFRLQSNAVGSNAPVSMAVITSELNSRAQGHRFGKLQELRMNLKGLSRSATKNIFTVRTTNEYWAFHDGGRSELQFNIGFEEIDGRPTLRHGVAFSLETSRALPSIEVLLPKIKLFNDYLSCHPETFSEMKMWHYLDGQRNHDYSPVPISSELVKEGVFIFLGKRQPVSEIDYDLVISDFDGLLPLYVYVEGSQEKFVKFQQKGEPFIFKHGWKPRVPTAKSSRIQQELDVNLRHNVLQGELFRRLVGQYGENNVGTEIPSGIGMSIDVVVVRPEGKWFYEIKTALSARACLREAIGQLFEYSFWPGTQQAVRLIVVGEPVLDEDGRVYMEKLRNDFSLPIYYEQITAGTVSP